MALFFPLDELGVDEDFKITGTRYMLVVIDGIFKPSMPSDVSSVAAGLASLEQHRPCFSQGVFVRTDCGVAPIVHDTENLPAFDEFPQMVPEAS